MSTVHTQVSTPVVKVGPTTVLGTVGAIVGAAGTIIAAVKANDTATVTAGAMTLLTALSVLGGRYAQAVAAIRAAAVKARPLIDAALDAAEGSTGGDVPPDSVFASLDPDDPGTVPADEVDSPAQPQLVKPSVSEQ
ncbi:hypothetical protein [Mycobacterium sp.]|uniref:hypothetical protein n=1 Tax=Mycobacterium sp. TaxID=1785 RepID=UPI00261ABE91|nr:hypothetical protein [Mycobacterium sp.]